MTDTWHLEDRRQFLERSLEDARREHDAGDLTDADYEALRRRDAPLLAAVEESIAERALEEERAVDRELDGGRPRADVVLESGAQGRSVARRMWGLRRRWWFAGAGVVMVVAGALLLVHALTAPRLPGQTVSGSIDLNTAQEIEQQLAQAKTLVRSGDASEALQVYGTVLSEDPKQPVALAEWGWLDWLAATKAKEATEAAEGASALEEAVRLDSRLFAAQYYLGAILLQEGAPEKAVSHFARFMKDGPTAAWRREAASEIRTAYAAVDRPVPAGI